MTDRKRYAGPVDIDTFGTYAVPAIAPGDTRPLLRFNDRITADDSSGFDAEAHRYHLYAGRFCPFSQRVLIARSLAGLDDVISVSFVDSARDGRGWAFRATEGPDPINGFTLLRDAYAATEHGFDGHISVPTLWDRVRGRVVSNDYGTIEVDLLTQFADVAIPVVDVYPAHLRGKIDDLDDWLDVAVAKASLVAGGSGPNADAARAELVDTLEQLDERLSSRRYLLGDRPTLADIRLFVVLVRFDVGVNAGRDISPGLTSLTSLWGYARDLYQQPAFGSTTDFSTFSRPGAPVDDWAAPVDRSELSSSSL